MLQRRRTLILGLDGFDFQFAQDLAGDGHMPWMRTMLARGSLVTTHAPELPGSEWVNAACGVSAAHHGYLHTSQLRLGSYESVETDAGVVASPPFYEPLALAGVKTVVVDLCVDRPRPQPNLVQVIDWATEFKLWRYCTTPRAERKFVEKVCPGHPLTRYGGTDPQEANLLALDDQLLQGTDLKARLIQALMKRHPDWDVFFAGFCEVHKAGHFFWKYHDSSHPEHPGNNHPLSNALTRHYRHLDNRLQQVVAAAGGDTDILIVADRGMRANLRGNHLIETLLVKLGLLKPARGSVTASAGLEGDQTRAAHGKLTGRRIKEQIPVVLRPWVRRLAGKERYDWTATRVFPLAEVGNTYFRVNLNGREPLGTVTASEYEPLLRFLERELLELRNAATGMPVVAQVVRPQETFSGALRDCLPDLGIVWRCDHPVTAVESPSVGRIEGMHQEQRSGNHSESGAILASGPAFPKGMRRPGDLRELAPTVLALKGLETPDSYEFPPMPELDRGAVPWSVVSGDRTRL